MPSPESKTSSGRPAAEKAGLERTDKEVLLAHGAGGRLTHRLIEDIFLKDLANPVLARLDDAAELSVEPGRIAFTTDAFVVHPLIFPGGDIGKLAVCGTINDLAMKGARPVALSAAFIIEEGLEISVLRQIVQSMKLAAKECGVDIVCGDTKVVERGAANKLFITTSGIGAVTAKNEISGQNARAGDSVLLSGTIADHGVSVLQARGEYDFSGVVESDCAALNGIVAELLEKVLDVHVLRDPTRGGLATTLNEIAKSSNVRIEINETSIPVNPQVQAACNLLGIDPLFIANEGKFIALVPRRFTETALQVLRNHPLGHKAVEIGRVVEGRQGVEMLTSIGGRRPIRMLEGEPLPRIC